MPIKVTLPDGSARLYEQPVSALKVAEDISPRLAEAAICAELDGVLVDLGHDIDRDAKLVLHTFKTDTGKDIY